MECDKKNYLEFKYRKTFEVLYNEISEALDYCPTVYKNEMIEYYLEYFKSDQDYIEDKSIIIMHQNIPFGVWPLSIRHKNGVITEIGSNGGALKPPLFKVGLTKILEEKLIKLCFEFIINICNDNEIKNINVDEQFIDKKEISEWHLKILRCGYSPKLSYDIFLNLEHSFGDIKKGFRRSYKGLINQARKHWEYKVYSQISDNEWADFQKLHLQVAGRKTRSDKSWLLQKEGINSGVNFFVGLRNASGIMVGGGLFSTSKDECFYAVGAYDRNLFDKPLGHLVQFLAIEEMVQRRMRWYLIGRKCNIGDVPCPDDKQLQVSNFMAGFGSHIFPRYQGKLILK